MEQTLGNILGKARDFKICQECKEVNWYENEECFRCASKNFKQDKEKIEERVERAIKSYDKEGYNGATILTKV